MGSAWASPYLWDEPPLSYSAHLSQQSYAALQKAELPWCKDVMIQLSIVPKTFTLRLRASLGGDGERQHWFMQVLVE